MSFAQAKRTDFSKNISIWTQIYFLTSNVIYVILFFFTNFGNKFGFTNMEPVCKGRHLGNICLWKYRQKLFWEIQICKVFVGLQMWNQYVKGGSGSPGFTLSPLQLQIQPPYSYYLSLSLFQTRKCWYFHSFVRTCFWHLRNPIPPFRCFIANIAVMSSCPCSEKSPRSEAADRLLF